MSEYYREQHPLLYEEGSEEEIYSPRYFRRARPVNHKDRRNHLKGAAAIFTRWPDHWSSFLTYWWIGLGMISLTTFIIYNSLFAFSMLPPAAMKPAKSILPDENGKTSLKSKMLPEVYMHTVVSHNDDIDLNQYIPFIERISNTFSEFQYNFIVIINDTNVGWMSAEENNDLALNTLWSLDKNVLEKEIHNHNINIKRITLSTFMDNSPLEKHWRTLPHHLIEFLVRTISIWDKGGVAINPDILTPDYQPTLYIKKLQMILNKYANTNKSIDESKPKNRLKVKHQKKSKKLNNIRDIIEALENEDVSENGLSLQTLSEAENQDIEFVRHERQVPNSNKNNSTLMNLIPLFLEFLFHKKADTTPKPTEAAHTNKTRKSVEVPNVREFIAKNTSRDIKNETESIYRPVIISVKGIHNKTEPHVDTIIPDSNEIDQNLEPNRLTIDMKGNIIATDTPCHAFLGTIYSNVIHHNEEESITDFIIAELTIFCKGLLSSCKGIDLILL